MFFDGDGCVARVAAGVDERDHFGGIFLEGILGDLLAVLHERIHVMEEGDFLANSLYLRGINMAAVPKHVGGGFGLISGAVVDGLGFEVVLVPAQPPITDVVFVEVFAGVAELFEMVRGAKLFQVRFKLFQVRGGSGWKTDGCGEKLRNARKWQGN